MLCRITVEGTLPSISLILCKFTSNSYCQTTVWHSHSTCFFSGEHKAASVQREYVASPWVTHCECWRLWNVFWNWASHKHFIFQKQSHYFCHSAWQMYICRPWCIHVAHVKQASSADTAACQQSSEEIFQICTSTLFSVFIKTHDLYLFLFTSLASLLD